MILLNTLNSKNVKKIIYDEHNFQISTDLIEAAIIDIIPTKKMLWMFLCLFAERTGHSKKKHYYYVKFFKIVTNLCYTRTCGVAIESKSLYLI